MRLFVAEACEPCEDVMGWMRAQGLSAEVVRVKKDGRHGGFVMREDGNVVPIPIPAVPALLNGEHLIVGTGIIRYLVGRMKRGAQ